MSLALVQLSLTVGIFLAILVYFVYQIKNIRYSIRICHLFRQDRLFIAYCN